MKVEIEKEKLLRALGRVQNIVERRTTIPILGNVLLVTEDQKLCLMTTDMEMEAFERVPAQIARGGQATVPAHMMFDIVRKLPDRAMVTMELDGSQMLLAAGRSRFRLGSLPVEDFPQISRDEFPNRFSMPVADLRFLIDHTRMAIAADDARHYLQGLYLHLENASEGESPMLRAVAVDGHRMARAERAVPAAARGMPAVIIPRKAVNELRRLLDEADDGMVELAVTMTKARFAMGSVSLTTRLVDGQFPDYRRVVPAGNDRVLEIDSRAFTQAVDRVAIMSLDSGRLMHLSMDDGHLNVSASSSQDGSTASEDLEASYKGPKLDMGFSSRYLLDVLQLIPEGTVRFTLGEAMSPAVVEDASDPSTLYVLMPIRL
ncbi:MAG: DNA polymerase III subunit beta [Alphaproteobacteria bacterium]|nr:MAG: DNA polymerase III subunit beta [Alphaproteobacteria bacterium]